MTTKEKIEVMQAFADGKQIQTRSVLSNSDWVDMNREPSWNWTINNYRIKTEEPKSAFRPYKDTDEMIEDLKQRFLINNPSCSMPLIWIKVKDSEYQEAFLITGFGGSYIETNTNLYGLDLSFKELAYLDGSPVGKLVEE